MASYAVNPDAVARAQQLIDSRQIVLDSDWGEVQPGAASGTRSWSRTRGRIRPMAFRAH